MARSTPFFLLRENKQYLRLKRVVARIIANSTFCYSESSDLNQAISSSAFLASLKRPCLSSLRLSLTSFSSCGVIRSSLCFEDAFMIRAFVGTRMYKNQITFFCRINRVALLARDRLVFPCELIKYHYELRKLMVANEMFHFVI